MEERTANDVSACFDAADPWELYSVGSQIGKGSYGTVFEAVEQSSGRVVALNTITLEETEETEEQATLAEMAKEVAVLQRCDSPFILPLLSAHYLQHTMYIITPLCEAGSLLDVMRCHRAPLSEPQLRAAASATLAGLNYLHAIVHCIHRDMKAALDGARGDSTGKLFVRGRYLVSRHHGDRARTALASALESPASDARALLDPDGATASATRRRRVVRCI